MAKKKIRIILKALLCQISGILPADSKKTLTDGKLLQNKAFQDFRIILKKKKPLFD